MKKFMPDVSPQERVRLLRENCDSQETTTYLRDLSQEELDNKRETLVDNLIKASNLEDELNEIKDGYKTKMKPLKDANKILQQEVKTRKEQVSGNLYHMANHEDGMMETYDENGDLVSTRRLRPEEKQARLFVAKAVSQ